MAFYNTGARYLFALGREGVLPVAARQHLPRTAARRRASMTVTGVVATYALAFTLYDPSTEGALLKLGTWSRCWACSASWPCRRWSRSRSSATS